MQAQTSPSDIEAPCRSPTVRGWLVGRIHGVGDGLEGTAMLSADRRHFSELIREARELKMASKCEAELVCAKPN
jgi:hypothetical protein